MRKLVYLVAVTLDGFVAGPDGGDPTGFWPITQDYLDYLVAEYPETLPGPARQALGVTAAGAHFDTVLEGRGSYEVGLRAGLDDAYPHLRHLVFSRSLPASDAVEIVSGDAIALVRELKQQDGKDIWVVGGGAIAGALRSEIDQLVVKLAPITLGSGIPLFGRDAGFELRSWQLTHHKVLESGTIFLTYSASTSA